MLANGILPENEMKINAGGRRGEELSNRTG
jgi:hypothetical protein